MKDESKKLITEILKAIGEDPNREGLLNTPKRVVKSWTELYGGYTQDPKDILSTTFEEVTCREMVILKDIEFFSMCEHHILPFYGRAHVGYIPNGKVVGLSKLARLVDAFARRLQIQENLTSQIAESISEHLNPLGCIVVVEAKHLCMLSRGVSKQNSTMVTSAVRGLFQTSFDSRAEFMGLIE